MLRARVISIGNSGIYPRVVKPGTYRYLRDTTLVDVLDGFPSMSEQTVVQKIWELCRRHGEQVLHAIRRMREVHDNPYSAIPHGSFLAMVSEREYLKEPIKRFVEAVCRKLTIALPLAFQHNQPTNENDFNRMLKKGRFSLDYAVE
jgi:predicted transcriptional regulator